METKNKDNQEMNMGIKIVCAVLLVAIVVAAGVGLLVQHRKLDELRRTHAGLERANQKLVTDHEELVAANGKLADEFRSVRDMWRASTEEKASVEKDRRSWKADRAN